MNKEQFLSFTLEQKIECVWQLGEYINTINYYGFRVSLFVMEKYCVEVYNNVHNNKIEDIQILDPEENRINLYVVNVNLSDLFN